MSTTAQGGGPPRGRADAATVTTGAAGSTPVDKGVDDDVLIFKQQLKSIGILKGSSNATSWLRAAHREGRATAIGPLLVKESYEASERKGKEITSESFASRLMNQIEPALQAQFDRHRLAHELLDAVRSAYVPTHDVLAINRKEGELIKTMQKEDEPVDSYYGRMCQLRSDLADLGGKMDDSKFMMTVVDNLTSKYRRVKESIATGASLLEDDVLNSCRGIERLREKERDSKQPGRALAATSSGGEGQKRSKGPKSKSCYECGKKGHFAVRCPDVVCSRCGRRGHKAQICKDQGPRQQQPERLAFVGTVSAEQEAKEPKESCGGSAAAATKWHPNANLSDWMLREELWAEINDEFGPHDVDAAASACGSNAQDVGRWFSAEADNFLEAKLEPGTNVWCNPPFSQLRKFLDKLYKLQEQGITSTVLVPVRKDASWWMSLVWIGELVKLWSEGQELFTEPPKPSESAERRQAGPCPFPVAVFRILPKPSKPYSPWTSRLEEIQLEWQREAISDPGEKQSKDESKADSLAANTVSSWDRRPTFLLDSGASCNICNDARLLHDLGQVGPADLTEVEVADGTKHRVKGKGLLRFKLPAKSGVLQVVDFPETYYVPSLTTNLIGVGSLTSKDGGKGRIVFDAGGATVELPHPATGRVRTIKCKRQGGLTPLPYKAIVLPKSPPGAAMATSSWWADEAQRKQASHGAHTWHARLGHLGYRNCARLLELVDGIDVPKSDFQWWVDSGIPCETCVETKGKRSPRPASTRPKAKDPLHRLHVDLIGKITPATDDDKSYLLHIVDEATRFGEVIPLATKDKAADELLFTIAKWERETSCRVKHVRCDQGREFVNRHFTDSLKSKGIDLEVTAAYSPESNGLIERANGTLTERMKALLEEAELPPQMWDLAAVQARDIMNISPAADLPKTPFELFYGRRPNLSTMRKFGCLIYNYVPKQKRTKLDKNVKRGVLVGWCPVSHLYRVLLPGAATWVLSRDVTCDETRNGWPTLEMGPASFNRGTDSTYAPIDYSSSDYEEDDSKDGSGSELQDDASREDDAGSGGVSGEDPPEDSSSASPPDRSPYMLRSRACAGAAQAVASKIPEPKTVGEARDSPQWPDWEQAMNAELTALEEQGTFQIVSLPPGARALPCKWVFSVKYNPDGSLDRFKARLVAGGHRQREGIDYEETYAPVTGFPVFRLMCAIAAAHDLELHAVDISNAFVQADLDRPVYMRIPDGYQGNACGGKVLQLNKSLYGLKQAPRAWHATFTSKLQEHGGAPCPADQSVWTHGSGEEAVHSIMYVDDLLLSSKRLEPLQGTKDAILGAFKGRDLGAAASYLGVQIDRDRKRRTLKISQPRLVEETLERFNMGDANPRPIPLAPGADMAARREDEEPLEPEKRQLYMAGVGSLQYLAGATRLDLCAPTNMLSQHMQCPTERHWNYLKSVLRYLAGTRDMGIMYGGEGAKDEGCFARGGGPQGCGGADARASLVVYTDSDWAADKDRRRSRHGYVLMVAGGAVAWQSKLQKSVAVSTAEAEYVGAAAAAREAVATRRVAHHLGVDTSAAVPLYCDNTAAIFMGENAALSAKTKHIDIQHHYLRDAVTRLDVELRRVPTADNPADMMTKALPEVKLSKFKSFVGMA